MTSACFLLAFWSPGPGEMLLLLVVALLLYGGDLPEVAKTWGKTLSDLRRNLTGLQRDFNSVIYSDPEPPRRLEYYPEFRDPELVEDKFSDTDELVQASTDDESKGGESTEERDGANSTESNAANVVADSIPSEAETQARNVSLSEVADS